MRWDCCGCRSSGAPMRRWRTHRSIGCGPGGTREEREKAQKEEKAKERWKEEDTPSP